MGHNLTLGKQCDSVPAELISIFIFGTGIDFLVKVIFDPRFEIETCTLNFPIYEVRASSEFGSKLALWRQ